MNTMIASKSRFRSWLLALWLVLGACLCGPLRAAEEVQSARPNIVIIYADDLGYGDVGCYGATRVKTPNVDRLAREGLRFTNAHSPSATCTPSRYALLTGEYAWRRKGTGILPGDASLIIQPGRATLPAMLRKAGYAAGAVGKWHLGLGEKGLDWNRDIKPGPLEIGFDYCFLIPATGDRVPCVYVENHRVVGLDPQDPLQVSFRQPVGHEPTGQDHPELLKVRPTGGHAGTIVNGISRMGSMAGGKAARWVDEDMADVITRRAVSFIERHRSQPFFLYFATHDIHAPRVPHPRFAGQTAMGPRGDVIVQFDWCAGEILKTLDRLKLAGNTLVILTSDNGPVSEEGYVDGSAAKLGGHRPAGPLRGGKYSAFDGGTRVPFIVRWPARIRPGVSGALVCQIDLLSSFAALTGQKLAVEDGPDSFNLLAALLGESRTGRDHLIEQAGALSVIKGSWKYIEPRNGPATLSDAAIESGFALQPQLYQLDEDLGEQRNVAAQHPDLVKELAAWLAKLREQGRSRPGE